MAMRWIEFGHNNMYRVSDCGVIQTRSTTGRVKGKIKAEWRDKKISFKKSDYTGAGYMVTGICENEKHRPEYVHRIVARYFIGEIGNGMQVNHIDGDRTNNHVKNLEIVSPKENIANAKNRGSFVGCGMWKGKIDDCKLLTIVTMINSGKSNIEIAGSFGIDKSNISKIRNRDGRTFKQMQYLVNPKPSHKDQKDLGAAPFVVGDLAERLFKENYKDAK